MECLILYHIEQSNLDTGPGAHDHVFRIITTTNIYCDMQTSCRLLDLYPDHI